MHDKTNRRRIHIALLGGSSREFDVYEGWIEKCYGAGCKLVRGHDGADARLTVPDTADLILADTDRLSLDDVQRLRQRAPVVVISGSSAASAGLDDAVLAGCMTKPLSRLRFKACLDPVFAEVKTRAARTPRAAAPETTDFESLSGVSAAMKTLIAQTKRVARSEAPVFINGEPGSGRHSCARAVHAASPRAEAPFVAVDCETASELGQTLFGSGGNARTGAFMQADGGTLYLANVQSLDAGLQAKVLHYLQTGTLLQNETEAPRFADVRLVCSAADDLRAAAERGDFRQDLFYRLFVLPLTIPALRDRPEDILPLARIFMNRENRGEGRTFVDFSDDAARALTAHSWPGNVSELSALVRQVAVLNDCEIINATMLPDHIRAAAPLSGADDIIFTPEDACQIAAALRELESSSDGIAPLWVQEQRIIETALAACEGHVGKAAEALQISPSTIYRKMQSWIDRETA